MRLDCFSVCARAAVWSGWVIVTASLAAALGAQEAEAPAGGAVSEATNHWSLRPLKAQPLPPFEETEPGGARTAIDRFVFAKLRERGLSPSRSADKRTLLRRIYFDLLGLPPSIEEMKAFLEDRSPNAWERVIEGLLASPRYGERWARHWMDLVHFAETHGHDQDRIRTNAWPYRDYLIEAFNRDKPYARFVEEQIAGDILYPDDPQATVALGFLATGPWDESSLRDIQEDTVDRRIARYIDRDDIVTTAMSTFTSSTVHCARCHDHKFDPISQEDYYALQAVFSATDKADRFYDADPELHRRRQGLLKQKAELEAGRKDSLERLLAPEVQRETASWEARHRARMVDWQIIKPSSAVSSGGAQLSAQPDSSVLAGGPRPETDTYTITGPTDLDGITAVRLEALADESLPHKGPGRQDNGNFHLNEFSLYAGPAENPAATNAVRIRRATSDFDQQDWTVAHAIDSKEKTAWGIYPQVGRNHVAVFELDTPLALPGALVLTFVLKQTHGSGHLIGRLRLGLTAARPPIAAQTLPETIAGILALPAGRRTAEQKIELAVYVLKERLDQDLEALPPPAKVYAGASDFIADGGFKPARMPRPIHVLRRGDIHRPGALAAPGALSCVPGLPLRFHGADPREEGSGRAALARWITDPQNPLAWRSIVNRVWQYHFGRGLVDSPNDFGRMGGTPTHPELLDWLAVWFQRNGGSFKKLHRLILTSAAYRQSSEDRAECSAIDTGNQFLWRMNRMRLEAECIRDAILRINGSLDLQMGGPSARQFQLSPGVHVTPIVDYAGFEVDAPENYRRSVYRFIFRTLPDPFMDALDCPDASQLTPARLNSVTPLQALALMNNPFVVRQCERWADRLAREGGLLEGQVARALELALNRPARPSELERLSEYARRHGLANACRILLNSNEFVFVN